MGDQNNNGETDTISREAFERIKRERDDLKAKAGELGETLTSYIRREKARAALRDKVADPDTVADLLAPHLKDIDPDQVADHVLSDAFAPKLAPFLPKEPTPPSAPSGDGEGGQTPQPAIEPNGFGAGPSPGGAGDAPTPSNPGNQIRVGSEEWNRMVQANDKEGIKKAYEEGRVVSSSAP